MPLRVRTLFVFIALVVGLSSSGNSLIPVPAEGPLPFQGGNALMNGLPALIPGGSIVFRSSLRNGQEDKSVILVDSERRRAHANDLSEGHDSLTSLPESGSGFLLCLGFLAIIPLATLAGRRRTSLAVQCEE